MSEVEELEKKLDSHIKEIEYYKETPQYTKYWFFKASIDKAIESLRDAKRDLLLRRLEELKTKREEMK